MRSTICASASTCANLCSPASKYYNKVQCAKLEADWVASGRADGRVYGCVTPAEALCYGNNYDNLRESMCNGTACATVQQAKQLESHYLRLGKAEGKTFGCVGGSVDALCYGNRYPELQTKFCDGGACHGVRVGELLKQHYEQWGRFQGRQFGCPSASIADDMCLGFGSILNCSTPDLSTSTPDSFASLMSVTSQTEYVQRDATDGQTSVNISFGEFTSEFSWHDFSPSYANMLDSGKCDIGTFYGPEAYNHDEAGPFTSLAPFAVLPPRDHLGYTQFIPRRCVS